jgi:AAHS family 4-hydroxybenzoate transporter-like MFS transporter
MICLPESVQFLVLRKNVPGRIARILRRIAPGDRLDGCQFVAALADRQVGRTESPFSLLLGERYRLGTLMLWVAYFMGLLIYYLLTNWLPTLMKDGGFSMRNAALMTSLFPLGGMVGNISVGWIMDRFDGARVLALTFGLTAALVLVAGQIMSSPGALGLLLFLCGALLISAATSMSALAVSFYPTQGRATGVSWMHGMGRPGGVAGAWVGAVLMGMGLDLGAVFSLLAVPALAAAGA